MLFGDAGHVDDAPSGEGGATQLIKTNGHRYRYR